MKTWFTLIALLLVAPLVRAGFDEGTDYKRLANPQPTVNPDQIEVLELFWYGCPHCRDFEPYVKQWAARLPENVRFSQVPVMFGGSADLHAQVYYALQGMGELERMHEPLFTEMHVNKNKLKSREAIDALLKQNGVDMDKFAQAMNSFAVAAKVNRARSLMRRYGVRSVPAMVVDGRYRSGTGFKGYQEIIEVVDHLVDKVLNHRKMQAGL